MKGKYSNLILTIILVSVIVLILIYNFRNNVEGLTNNDALSNSFCAIYENNSNKMQKACSRLTGKSCKNIGCCVWANEDTCLAGGVTGPTYKTDAYDKEVTIDNYYYMNKCYGSDCPE
jgi:hypothetical protein